MTDRQVKSDHSTIPNSPIAGENEVRFETRLELRRARATVEVIYRAEPGEFVDIQQAINDAVGATGREHMHRDLGDVLYAVDLTEHVVLDGRKEIESQ